MSSSDDSDSSAIEIIEVSSSATSSSDISSESEDDIGSESGSSSDGSSEDEDEVVEHKKKRGNGMSYKDKRDLCIRITRDFKGNPTGCARADGKCESTYRRIFNKGYNHWEALVKQFGRSRKNLKRKPKGKYHDVEVELQKRFIQREHDKGLRDDEWIKQEGLRIMKDFHPQVFSANGECSVTFSRHWISNFKRRFGISSSRTDAKLPFASFWPIYLAWIYMFRIFLHMLGMKCGAKIERSQIYNTDETPLHFASWMKKMNKSKKAQENSVFGVRFTRDLTKRFATVVLTLRADNYEDEQGYMYGVPPCLIFHGQGQVAKKQKAKYARGVEAFFQKNAWFDNSVGIEFVRAFKRFVPDKKVKVLLVDNLSSHTDVSFSTSFKEHCNVYVKALPPNMTHLIQPVDRHVAVLMKNKIKQRFRDFYESEHKKFVETKTVQVVDIATLRIETTKWVKEAWVDMKKESNLIKRSFSATGLSLPLDGSEDQVQMKLKGAPESHVYTCAAVVDGNAQERVLAYSLPVQE
jgi:hypothetical protein